MHAHLRFHDQRFEDELGISSLGGGPRQRLGRATIPPMRLMSWNLLEGACQVASDGSTMDHPDRLEAAQALVHSCAPDILVINEALWCQPWEGHYVDYAARFGFPDSCGKLYDHHWGNVILSRYPVVACRSFDIYNRGGLLAEIATPQGVVCVATYHPHPSRWPVNKSQDFVDVAALSPPGKPLFLCGDFNAISPDDQPDHDRLALAFARFAKDPVASSARFVDGGQAVFPRLVEAGLRDAVPNSRRGHTMPTRLVSDDDDSRMRIDHVWVNSQVVVQDARVCHDPLADKASDHYPLLVDFALA